MKERETTKPPIVILSSISWDFLWQRHQVLATHFVRAGHRVVFIEGISFGLNHPLNPSYYTRAAKKFWRKARPAGGKNAKRKLPRNLTVYECVVAPLRPRFLRRVNARLSVPHILEKVAGMGVQNPVVWSYQPTETAMLIAKGLAPSVLVYDCVTNFEQAPWMPEDICETEREWLDAADLVLADSVFLAQKHAGRRLDLVQLPPGVDYELFNQAYSARDLGAPVRRVCFFGGMGDYWFDFELVERIAEAGFEVFLIGYRITRHRVLDHPNVTYVLPVSQAELPALLKPMDALLIPYKMNGFTKGVFPSKVYECLATGKPLVATPLPDLRRELSEYVYLAGDAQEFIDVLRRLPESETQEKVRARLELARANSWESRLDVIFQELERLRRD